MSEDRSLDEFFDSSDDQSESDDDERATESATAVDDTDADTDTAVEGVAPTDLTDTDTDTDTDTESPTDEGDETALDQPRPTYRWSPDGEDCPVCGRSTNTQWHDGGRFVCADCKEW